jgi:cysteinyl-tRNA synthetase
MTDVMPEELDELFKTTRDSILEALQNDLGTPTALASLSKLIDYMSNIAIPGVEGKYTDGTLAFLDKAFGLDLSNRPDITGEQKRLIREREAARQGKDWQTSDDVRDQLKEQGIGLRDTPHGSVWYRLKL